MDVPLSTRRSHPITVGNSCPDSSSDQAKNRGLRLLFPLSTTSSFLVAESVLDSSYRGAISLGIPVVTPSILNEEDPFEDATITRHTLPIFSGLSIHLAGFPAIEKERNEEFIGRNGGRLSPESSATHIVAFDREGRAKRKQILVSALWLRECEDLGWCANEVNFKVPRRLLLRRSARKTGKWRESLRRAPSVVSSEGPPPPAPLPLPSRSTSAAIVPGPSTGDDKHKYKRYQLAMELYKCEIDALRMVDFLVRISSEADMLIPRDNELIFSTFRGLHPVVTKIVERLGASVGAWSDATTIGDIYTSESVALSSAYLPYFHSLEASLRTFKRTVKENQRFAHFIEEKEKDRAIGRQKIEHLINVPYQQMMSRTTVLLKEIAKHTDYALNDASHVQEAIETIEGILERANSNRSASAETDELFNQIHGLPAVFFHCPRSLLGRYSVFSYGGTGSWSVRGRALLLVFEDLLLLVLSVEGEGGCMSSRHGQSFRYVQHCIFDAVREVVMVEREDSALYFVTIRTELSDDDWRIVDEGKEIIEALESVMRQVRMTTARAISISRVPFSRADYDRQSAMSSLPSPAASESSPFAKIRTLSLRMKRGLSKSRLLPSTSSLAAPLARCPSSSSRATTASICSSQESSSSSSSSSSAASWSLNESDPRLRVPVEPYDYVTRFAPIGRLRGGFIVRGENY